MEPLRSSPNPIDLRARAFAIIKERSVAHGRFQLASGRISDIYLDLKPSMFDPQGAAALAALVLERIAELEPDYIGGIEMGAVPLVTAVAMASANTARPIPGFFVRKAVKDHGTKKRIEAVRDLTGRRVVILEDVTTTGGSAMEAVAEVQAAGASVVLVLSIVDREEGAAELYARNGLAFASLFRLGEFTAS